MPPAVIVEIFRAGHLGRDVVGGFVGIFAPIPVHTPLIKIIALWNLPDLVVEFVTARKSCALSGNHVIGISPARCFSAPLPYGGDRFRARLIDVDAVIAAALNRESQVGGIDLQQIAIIQMTHSQLDRAER